LLASIRTAPFLSLTATHSRQFLFPLPRLTPPDLLPGRWSSPEKMDVASAEDCWFSLDGAFDFENEY
jgi:hypothetical protein